MHSYLYYQRGDIFTLRNTVWHGYRSIPSERLLHSFHLPSSSIEYTRLLGATVKELADGAMLCSQTRDLAITENATILISGELQKDLYYDENDPQSQIFKLLMGTKY